MSTTLPLILFALLNLAGCKFTYSPYEVGTAKLHQNTVNLRKIQSSEGDVGTDYKVALISDTHNFYDDLHDLVKKINANGPYSFVIITGDITNQGLLEEYQKTKEYLNNLRFPYLVAVGNHDLLSNGDRVYQNFFGKTDFSLIYKDAEFIFFNNNNWETGGSIHNRVFVEAQLLASVAPQKILVAHVSPNDKERFSQEEIQSWKDLMTTYGVSYFVNGHDHNPNSYSFGSAQRITVGAPNKRSYYELQFSAGGVTHQKISF